MAYDVELAGRIRELLSHLSNVIERKMFGGLAFLVNGHMAVSANGQGGILVRADPARCEQLAKEPMVEIAVMRHRPMRGWLRVEASGVTTKQDLERWVTASLDYVSGLPPKSPR